MAKLHIDKIQIDETIYPRSGVSDFNVNRLVSAIKTGVKLPPILVEAKTHRLVDGRHRLEAYKKLKIGSVDVVQKVYKNEADLYADAVSANIGHGEPLDQFSVHQAIIRLEEYGYSRDRISEVVRLPVDTIEKITRGFAHDATSGKPIALKGGLHHLAGHSLTTEQQQVNRRYSGPKCIFHLRQLIGLLQSDMAPMDSASFVTEMDRLCDIWLALKSKGEAA